MPITVIFPPEGIGPGIVFQLSTDLIGPIPAGAEWRVNVYADADQTQLVYLETFDALQLHAINPILMTNQSLESSIGQAALAAGMTATVHVELREQPGVLGETVTVQAPWTTANLGQQALNLAKFTTTGPGQGGFTETDRQALTEVQASTALTVLVDNLTLHELTSGPTGDFVGAALPETFWGIIIRIASVPPELVPQTPDGDYWTPSLAVVRIFRGSDLWMRVPVHTSSKMIPIYNEHIASAVAEIVTGLWLLNMSLQVTFRDGVLGQVFLMRFP